MSSSQASPESNADPFSFDFFHDPYPVHHELREAGPVVRLTRCGYWAVARYNEVNSVLNDWQTFSSARGVGIADFSKEKPWRAPSLVLEADPPLHDRARKVLNRVLSPATVRGLRDHFAKTADDLIEQLLDVGEFDAVPQLAEAFPLSVFPDAVGISPKGRENLLIYGDLTFDALGPRDERLTRKMDAAAAAIAWVQTQTQRSALSGGLGMQIHEAADSGEITPEEASLLVRSLLSAGLDTTVSALGAVVYCLARNPEQFEQLRSDPSLSRNAFEEAIRLENPVQHFFRTTTRKITVGDTVLGEGEKVLVFYSAANRDPRRWEQPDTFDIKRSNAGHVGFGAGIHKCVGQVLARLEGEVVLAALARKVRSITLAGPVSYPFNNSLRKLGSLSIRIQA